MRPEVKAYLFNVRTAVEPILQFTADREFADYAANAMLRSAVERQFEIIGEALNQLSKAEPTTAEKISGYRRIIAFRNVLIHGYATVDDRVVWNIVTNYLTALDREVAALLEVSG